MAGTTESQSFVATPSPVLSQWRTTQDEENGNTVEATMLPNGNSPPRPSLKKAESVEVVDYKKLNRGISRATDNVNLVSQVRCELVLDNIEQDFFIETPIHTFTLPDFAVYAEDFRQFLEKDLIAVSTQQSLEQANRLNWWSAVCQRLWPLSTSGDGNCLLHAASLGMWGFHDRLLTLRKSLHAFLSSSPRHEALWRRWRRQQSALNAQAGLIYSEVEWRREWNAIVNMASTEPRLRRLSVASDHSGEIAGAIYESLEEIHVLALAHVLKRPIIVVSDTMLRDMNGEPLAPIPFGGIYLPLECSPSECHRSPLLLAYDGGHFSALVAMDTPADNTTVLSSAIPLVDVTHELLPIQFCIDPGEREDFGEKMELGQAECLGLLKEYLDVLTIDLHEGEGLAKNLGKLGSIGKSVGQKLRLKLTRSNSQRGCKNTGILCAQLHTDKRHEYHDTMIKNYLHTARVRFNQQQDQLYKDGGIATAPRYGAGKSQFYTEADLESHERISQLTPVKPITNSDDTVYLCNSTFYQPSEMCRAEGCPFFGNPQTQNYCSKCFREQLQCKES
ncbi:OTU domain-containing protein 7B-like isoform X2 [Macrosteles quadrilineatus]|uniref:OTU domain-containing protein 7B-like isoform X2 n=1 Tax=Macrosteles quadrilineatus TaxID=74068 RepID=UPI0023E1E150|nr:OTU domain-containing protein 7B-like isoform X2 [Macrosteles quadrilineatus]XP_054287221.1 OTU domain-containing protein 7B-like isoform X2 [Macrosteles quadrilineatus]